MSNTDDCAALLLEHIDATALILDHEGHVKAGTGKAVRHLVSIGAALLDPNGRLVLMVSGKMVPASRWCRELDTGPAEVQLDPRDRSIMYLTLRALPMTAVRPWLRVLAVAHTRTPANVDQMQMRWGLTRQEAHVALQLSRGKRPAEVADALGIARSTVATHIRGIYEKTGTNSLVPMVAKLLCPTASADDGER